ncbi:MAG TPA: calcium/sodium antiporter [Candidatus Onthousia faecavium]|nr:calcium/sodium antiporter [Candidatus Onthousia faecavium]
MELFFLILGFIVIIKATSILVDCASSLALKCKVPKILIALTIVAFGTSAPEIGISFSSIASNNDTIAFANVIGSCIVNVFLIIGLGAIINPLRIKHTTIKKELPLLLIITTSFAILMLDSLFNPLTSNYFSRSDALILIAIFMMFILYIVQTVRKGNNKEEELVPKYRNIFVIISLLILSLAAISISSNLIVDNAQIIARKLNISEKIITMTVIVIGTSLPELIMTVTSAHKKEFDMAIGNIIGTNIFNICIVLGLPILIYGGIPLTNYNIVDILAVFLTSLVLFFFSRSMRVISKKEGFVMISIFIAYYLYLFLV